MAVTSYFRSLCLKLLIVPVVAFLLGIFIPGVAGYAMLRRNAERETQEKARMVRATLDAIPVLNSVATADVRGLVCPVRILAGSDRKTGSVPYRFKTASNNPTNNANKADGYENGLISAFAADRRLNEVSGEISANGNRFQVIARPIVMNQEKCLRCHSNPKIAPAALVKQFGKAGFGRKKGEVVGAAVLYIPAELSYRQSALIYVASLRTVSVLSLICLALLAWRAFYVVARPLDRLLNTSRSIRHGDWTARFQVRFPDEISTLAMSFQDTTFWLRDQIAKEEKLRSLFQQFIPASVAAQALGKDPEKLLVGSRHPVTVLSLNIRNFKLLTQNLPADETVAVLNDFFRLVNKTIIENRGMVSKYLGDSVLAFFGVIQDEGHAINAVRAALAIPAALQDLYVRLDEKHGWDLGVGIGISTGEPIVGHFGSSEHMEYTVLGDVVVESSRLEELTKGIPEEDSVLISETTYREVMSDVQVLDLGERKCKDGVAIHAYAVQGLRFEVRKALAA